MARKIKVILRAREYNSQNSELLEDISAFFPVDDITIIQSPTYSSEKEKEKPVGRDEVLEGILIKNASELLDKKPTNKYQRPSVEIPSVKNTWKNRFKGWIKQVSSKGVSIAASEMVKTVIKNLGDDFMSWM